MTAHHFPEDAPSDTPRTDAAISQRRYYERRGAWYGDDVFLYVEPEDARSIERELQAELAAQSRELASLRARMGMMEKDAERYRWLRSTLHAAKAGGGVEVNDALQVYEDPVENEQVRVYWYPDTPIGFYQVHGPTLDAAIDAAIERSKG